MTHRPFEDELARVLRALGHPVRLCIVRLLGQEARAVSWLAERTGQARPSMSQHLSLLRLHRVVIEHRRGRRVFYRLVDPRLAQWLDEGVEIFRAEATIRATATTAVSTAAEAESEAR